MNEFEIKFPLEIPDDMIRFVIEVEMQTKDPHFHELHMLCFQQAYELFEQENDAHFTYLYASKFFQLMRISSLDYLHSNKVEIVTARNESCKHCRELQGKVFTIEQAFKEMPIPVKSCTKFCGQENAHPDIGWCRCLWEPVL